MKRVCILIAGLVLALPRPGPAQTVQTAGLLGIWGAGIPGERTSMVLALRPDSLYWMWTTVHNGSATLEGGWWRVVGDTLQLGVVLDTLKYRTYPRTSDFALHQRDAYAKHLRGPRVDTVTTKPQPNSGFWVKTPDSLVTKYKITLQDQQLSFFRLDQLEKPAFVLKPRPPAP